MATVTNWRPDDAYTCTVGRLLMFFSAPSFTCSPAAAACFPFLPAPVNPTHPFPPPYRPLHLHPPPTHSVITRPLSFTLFPLLFFSSVDRLVFMCCGELFLWLVFNYRTMCCHYSLPPHDEVFRSPSSFPPTSPHLAPYPPPHPHNLLSIFIRSLPLSSSAPPVHLLPVLTHFRFLTYFRFLPCRYRNYY